MKRTVTLLLLLIVATALAISATGDWLLLLGRYEGAESHFFFREIDGSFEFLFESTRGTISFNGLNYMPVECVKIHSDTYLLEANPLNFVVAVFQRDEERFGIRCKIDREVFVRLFYGPEGGDVFKITPVRPVKELLPQALEARPPEEAGELLPMDLVDIEMLDPKIKLDIRYAREDNFMGSSLYTEEKAFLQRPAAYALVKASEILNERGLGLVVHDAYRPWYVTKMFWDATPDELKEFVADPEKGSRHNRGCAVDVSLYSLETGEFLDFGGGYDEFSERSYIDFPGGSTLQRYYRELLRETMATVGFQPLKEEWWHFDFEGWERYPIGNITFEELERSR
jgi:D-alanyl-D-alanine dipeptidase